MSEGLPITFRVEGLFEPNDPKSGFLISKLEAWLNFKGMCANWFSDEAAIVQMHICLLPEKLFLAKQLDEQESWQTLPLPTAVYLHTANNRLFDCYLMLSNDEIDQAMKAPQQLEQLLQNKLCKLVNHLASQYRLAEISV